MDGSGAPRGRTPDVYDALEPHDRHRDVFTNTQCYAEKTQKTFFSTTEDFLASGTVDSSQSDDIRNSLSEWYFFGDNLNNQYDLLREAHSKLDDYTYTLSTAPRLHTMSEVSVMQDHPRSKFPFDHYALLADPRVENLLALYLLRMEFVTRDVNIYQERQANLLSSINLAIENWQ